MVLVKKYLIGCSMSLSSSPPKYDDFGELVWKEPKRKPKPSKKFIYQTAFKQLGEALI